MTTYCSKSFEIVFWSLSLFNTYIQRYPSSSLKISPAIFHDADCHDFDLSNEENTHHISMHARPYTMVWWTSQPFFACQLFARRCFHQFSYVVTLLCMVILRMSPTCLWRGVLGPAHDLSLPLLLIICL